MLPGADKYTSRVEEKESSQGDRREGDGDGTGEKKERERGTEIEKGGEAQKRQKVVVTLKNGKE